MRKKQIGCVLFLVAMMMAIDLGTADAAAPDSPLVVFLVRHAEKVDASRDPALSDDGKVRAEQLATLLRDAELKHIHSSDYVRTRATSAPLAAKLELQVELYDPRKLAALITKLRATGGRHLVVGHSTTTPEVVKMLDGTPGPPIHEASEYDRLYIVTIGTNGDASTVLMRFGKPFKETVQ